MDHVKFGFACAAIEAFFTEVEKVRTEQSDWRYNGQTFGERVEGHVLGVIESLMDEIENPDPSKEDQSTPTDDSQSNQDGWWWLAVNGPSCAACGFPTQADRLEVSPVPEQLIGFRTREEQLAAQKLLITAPINKVKKFMASLPSKIDSREVAYIRPTNPEPPTCGPTVWSIAPKQDASLNERGET